MTADDPVTPPAPSRLGAFRLRTLLAIVAAIAAVLGARAFLIRRQAVNELMALVPHGGRVFAHRQGPCEDRRYDLMWEGPPIKAALAKVRRVGASGEAVGRLAAMAEGALHAEGELDESRSALAVLVLFGEDAAPARDVAVRVVKGGGPIDSRAIALTLLGRLATTDAGARDALIGLISFREPGFDRWLLTQAAHELMCQGREARDAVPALIARASDRSLPDEANSPRRAALLHALRPIGPDARAAVPALKAFALDREEALMVRLAALQTLASTAIFVGPNTETPGVLPRDVLDVYRTVARDPGPAMLQAEARGVLAELDRRAAWTGQPGNLR